MEHFEKYFRAENDLYYQYGEIKGEEKGELKGEIKGEIRGEIRGEIKANETTALKMIRKGLNLQLIQEITGLTPERLAEIQKGASAD